MVIRECGILFRGFNLIFVKYHKASDEKIDKDLRSALLTALLNFAENVFTKDDAIEYFEMKKFAISFTDDIIKAEDSPIPEPILVYAILDKEKKLDKYISKVLIPSLKEIMKKFKKDYEGKNLSETSQFEHFRENIDKILGAATKTMDERARGTLF